MSNKTIKTAIFNGTWGQDTVNIIKRVSGAHKGTYSIYGGGFTPTRAMSEERAQRIIENDRRFVQWAA